MFGGSSFFFDGPGESQGYGARGPLTSWDLLLNGESETGRRHLADDPLLSCSTALNR
jgi:hypothetical protein